MLLFEAESTFEDVDYDDDYDDDDELNLMRIHHKRREMLS